VGGNGTIISYNNGTKLQLRPFPNRGGSLRNYRKQLCVLLCVILVAGEVAATDPTTVEAICTAGMSALHATVAPLPHTPRKTPYPGAFTKAGEIVKSGTSLNANQKEDGVYVYLVVRHGDAQSLVWSMRAPGEAAGEPGKNLATHDSLYNKASADLGEGVEVIAAGQAVIANDLVARIDNKSYTRRGDAARLGIGEEALKAAGLKFVDEGNLRTQRIDFSTAKNPDGDHQADAQKLANLRSAQDADSQGAMSGELIRAWHHNLYQRYPQLRHPTVPGMIDEAKLFDAKRLFPNGKFTTDEQVAMLEAKDVFRLMQREGVELANAYLLEPEFDSYGAIPRVTRITRLRKIIALALETKP
jgi:hypothetical protein